MTTCSHCHGYGIRMVGEDVGDCWQCGGAGVVEARDDHGRFLPWRTVPDPAPRGDE